MFRLGLFQLISTRFISAHITLFYLPDEHYGRAVSPLVHVVCVPCSHCNASITGSDVSVTLRQLSIDRSPFSPTSFARDSRHICMERESESYATLKGASLMMHSRNIYYSINYGAGSSRTKLLVAVYIAPPAACMQAPHEHR